MKEQLPARIESDTLKKLKELAKQENRTLSNYIDITLTQHVSKSNLKYQPKKETNG